jgi:hypothetical protein
MRASFRNPTPRVLNYEIRIQRHNTILSAQLHLLALIIILAFEAL